MLAYIPYMDPMGNYNVFFFLNGWFGGNRGNPISGNHQVLHPICVYLVT